MEVFKDVIGFEEYFQVSNLGRVYSKRTSKILKQTKLKSGYLVINTKIGGRKGTAYSLRVHRMVAEAFLAAAPKELVDKCADEHYGKVLVRHIDDDKLNNVWTNLVWGSCQDNSDDYVETGRSKEASLKGHLNPLAKFTEDQVAFIRDNYIPNDPKFGCRALALRYDVSHARISGITTNKTYISG